MLAVKHIHLLLQRHLGYDGIDFRLVRQQGLSL